MEKLLLSAFSEYPRRDVGGANKIIFQTLENIDYLKYAVSYISCNLNRNFTSPNNLENQIVSSINIKKRFGSKLFQDWMLFRKAFTSHFYFENYLKRCNSYFENLRNLENFDVIHSHDFRTLYYLGKNDFRKKIFTIHSKGSFLNEFKYYVGTLSNNLTAKYRMMEDECINIADVITFPSNAAMELFISESDIKINKNKVKVIYNGVDTNYIRSIPANQQIKNKYSIKGKLDILLINVADHIKVKNIDLVLRTVKYLKDRYKLNAFLVNVGIGPETRNLKLLSKELEISNQVKFLGKISYEDLIRLLKVGDFLISCADKVVFDLIILEALASGIVVIASNNGGNKEAIQDKNSGYLVNNFSEAEFGDTIIKSSDTVKLNAIKWVEKFDVKSMVKNFQLLYN